MIKCVDVDKLIDKLVENYMFDAACVVEDVIQDMPIVDDRVLRHGDWVDPKPTLDEGDEGFETELVWHCSVCGERLWTFDGDKPTDNYCPGCGAKMDGK